MDATLLMRLEGPMQSWGIESRFSHRDTGREPSKSGIIGLICAALGKPRREAPEDGFPTLRQMCSLRMGVRVDREGVVQRDYHTAKDVLRARAKHPGAFVRDELKETELSNRFYLADASFLVGLQGDEGLLERMEAALRDPAWPLFLGRRAFAPSRPPLPPSFLDSQPWAALRREELTEALRQAPWLKPVNPGPRVPEKLRLVLDDPAGAEMRQDAPLSFELGASRRHAARRVCTEFIRTADLAHVTTGARWKEGA